MGRTLVRPGESRLDRWLESIDECGSRHQRSHRNEILSKPIIAGPGTACTETYLVAGRFKDEASAKNYASYLRTRFIRFLVSLRKMTQHATRDVYAFVPDLPTDQEWTDDKLYKRYSLTAGEIEYLESQVAAHNDAKSDDE